MLNFQNWHNKLEKLDKFFSYTLQMKNQHLLADFLILQTHLFIHPVTIRWVMQTIYFDFANTYSSY